MCGIVAVISRPGHRSAPDLTDGARRIAAAATWIERWAPEAEGGEESLERAVESCEAIVHDLRGFAGLLALLEDGDDLAPTVFHLGGAVKALEKMLDQVAADLKASTVERLNALLIRAKDAHFALAHARIGNIARVRDLAPTASSEGYWRVAYDLNVALNSLDRLEVRGRDSAGLHLFVRGDLLGVPSDLDEELEKRGGKDNFQHHAVRLTEDRDGRTVYSFVYKVAAEVGCLGENVQSLRLAIAEDRLLHALLALPGVTCDVLGHTRWASVGVVSEENAHPLNQERDDGAEAPYVVAALNGDVDNFARLVEEESLSIPASITTDAKVIPALVSDLVGRGETDADAFRKAVGRMEGSVAIACQSAAEPGVLRLALRGSGQALYVGLADGAFLVASEPYGIVEEASGYLRLDGETPLSPDRPQSRGQIVVLDASGAGERPGIQRLAYDGTPLPVGQDDIHHLEITTRDVDRGDYTHYLKKELIESPDSIRKTIRGKILVQDGRLDVRLGERALPTSIREGLRDGRFRRIRVIGQGTAAVAGQGVAELIGAALKDSTLSVDAMPASEVSGFHLRDDMRDDLFVAISQSGTTTDTNRTVDLLRARGAAVLAIVNRRHSDLTDKADGVLYTSDGRDVEMSVASTKAFYSQIAAGVLLGEALADATGAADLERRQRVLEALKALPGHMRTVLDGEEKVAAAARETAPYRKYWAVVGNGRNRVAAQEIRIKLSELCYKSIACDATEDKKHIDLSSEPLILVCAAGVERGNAQDVEKEVEIFAAHKACPVVIASEGGGTWRSAKATLLVPDAGRELTFVLATMVGHLFGYHAALSIDALARPLREARAAVEETTEGTEDVRETLRTRLDSSFQRYCRDVSGGRYDGSLDAKDASRLALSFRYATGIIPLEFFADDFGRPGTPFTAVGEFVQALSTGIELLTRPIDAIKHQAKTVTVGISRGDEALMAVPLVRAVIDAGATSEQLAYADLKELAALDGAVAEIKGFTRYAIERSNGDTRIRVVGRGGVASTMASRTSADGKLQGTKNTVALERRVQVAVGRSDGRPIILVPERSRGSCTGITLLHTQFGDSLDAPTVRAVLSGYRSRYVLIRDAVAETGAMLRDDDLVRMCILDLLTQPVLVIADRLTGAVAN